MKIPDDAIMTYFDGFSKSAYLVYTSGSDGYGLDCESAKNKFVLYTKRMYDYLESRLNLTYDVYDMMAISHDMSMTCKYEEMLMYFYKLTGVFENPDLVISSSANQSELIWNVSDIAKLSYFVGLTWMFDRNERNRTERLIKFLKLATQHIGVKIDDETMLDVWNYFADDQKIEEMKLKIFDILKVRYVYTGNLKHKSKKIRRYNPQELTFLNVRKTD